VKPFEGPLAAYVRASSDARGAARGKGWRVFIDELVVATRIGILSTKPHTRMLETLAVEIALLSFAEWPALEAITLALHKPKIREGTRRIGVELDWTRGDFEAHSASALG
jgi:dihydroneopterin aldolase